MFARPSRYWLLKKLLNLLASGFVHVEVRALLSNISLQTRYTYKGAPSLSFQVSGVPPDAVCHDPHYILLADFWLSDQFCSLAFSFSSLWTLGCSVRNNWAADSYDKCGVSHHWQTPLVLSCVPALMRLLQCVKRYVDSGLRIHMINVSPSMLR